MVARFVLLAVALLSAESAASPKILVVGSEHSPLGRTLLDALRVQLARAAKVEEGAALPGQRLPERLAHASALVRSAQADLALYLESGETAGELLVHIVGAHPERALDDRRRLDRVHHHLAAIGPKKRVAYLLHTIEGLSVDEIAGLTGAGRFATKSRIYWARLALLARVRRDPLLRDLLRNEGGEGR